jgi:hypothetical protein
VITQSYEISPPHVAPVFNHLHCPTCGSRCGFLYDGLRCLDCELDMLDIPPDPEPDDAEIEDRLHTAGWNACVECSTREARAADLEESQADQLCLACWAEERFGR